MNLPNTHAAQRHWGPAAVLDLRKHPTLDAAWRNSQRLLLRTRQLLHAAELDPRILTVVASGSLGRMEAVAGSDGDLIVVLRDDIPTDAPQAQQAWDSVWSALAPLELPHSRSGGIFAIPTTSAALCNADARGKIDEDIPTFGKRFQLLCDAQPVYGDEAYEKLIAAVIAWYTASSADDVAAAWWRYLLNDLLRYYRSMCVASQWDRSHGPGFRRMRNFKHAHSRSVMYAALLCLLGECSKLKERPRQRLQTLLRLTPLERLAWTCPSTAATGMTAIAVIYERYLELLNDPTFRQTLLEDDLHEPRPAMWPRAAKGDDLRGELSRFLEAQRQHWDPEFVAALWL